jgi:hypothetical protein
MSGAKGYIVLLDRGRWQEFQCFSESTGWRFARLDGREDSFGEPVPEFTHSRNKPLVCFIVHHGHITHLALGRRGTSGGTFLRVLRMENTFVLPNPIAWTDIVDLLPNRFKRHLSALFKAGGLASEKALQMMIEALRQVSPKTGDFLHRHSASAQVWMQHLDPRVAKNLGSQQQAVLTALQLAGLNRSAVLKNWTPPSGAPQSFLDVLQHVQMREDAMLLNDCTHLPGFEYVRRHIAGANTFVGEKARVTILLANRLPLEELTGTDLVYYNETFHSFVMVQYKAMESESTPEGAAVPSFRFPKAELSKELSKMEAWLGRLKGDRLPPARDGFRMMENPFFLKLCPRLVFNPDDAQLVPGMYLPLDYWKILESDPATVGPRGGRLVTFKNVGRHLDNTMFIMMVSNAWVGTVPSQSDVLASVFRETLESGRALALAVRSSEAN